MLFRHPSFVRAYALTSLEVTSDGTSFGFSFTVKISISPVLFSASLSKAFSKYSGLNKLNGAGGALKSSSSVACSKKP